MYKLNKQVMKKIMLIAVVTFVLGWSAYAQDTTRSANTRQQSNQTWSNQDQTKGDMSMKGWTKVNSSDVPASLRQTLSGSQYTGWEKSTLYRSEAGDRYAIRIGDQKQMYYFDKAGKPVKGMMDPGMDNTQTNPSTPGTTTPPTGTEGTMEHNK